MKKISKRLALFIVSLIPKGKFSQITYYKHSEDKWLYICMSEKYIKEESQFYEIFPYAIRVSRFEFDVILFLNKDLGIVTVSDDSLQDLIGHTVDDEKMQEQVLTEYHESEDKDINEK